MRFHFLCRFWFPDVTVGGWAGSQLSLGRVKERGKGKAGPGEQGRGCPRLEELLCCLALVRNMLGKGVQEVRRWVRTGPLNSRSPSMSLQGLWISYMKNYTCVCVCFHIFVGSIHNFSQILKGLHYPKQTGSNLSLYRWRNLVERIRNEWVA